MKLVSIVGARPQFVKAAPVSRAIARHKSMGHALSITDVLVHTGQHYDHNMSQVFFDQLQIPKPDYHLGVGSGSHGQMTGAMLIKIEEVLNKEKPDLVMVYGDTNSTLAGALAAVKLNIPVAHVEAGLRSFNRRTPEEINRLVADHLSTILFCPTNRAVENLRAEGIVDGKETEPAGNTPHNGHAFELIRRVVQVGDVMYDAFLFNREVAAAKSSIIDDQGLPRGTYYLATIHRQENTDDPDRLRNIFSAFDALATEANPLMVPLHPRTKKVLEEKRIGNFQNRNIRIIPPVSYLDMIALESHAKAILTDSGGMQKEAYFVRVPCVTFRDETEWVETVDAGWNAVVGCDPDHIIRSAREARPGKDVFLYGEGKASEAIVEILSSHFSVKW